MTTQEEPSESQLEKLRTGVEISTGTTYPAQVKQRDGKIRIIIHEGKKRQIRRMLAAVGLTVIGLKRIRVGKMLLPKNLPEGKYLEIKKAAII